MGHLMKYILIILIAIIALGFIILKKIDAFQQGYYRLIYWQTMHTEKAFINNIENGNFQAAYQLTLKKTSFELFCNTADSVRTALNKTHYIPGIGDWWFHTQADNSEISYLLHFDPVFKQKSLLTDKVIAIIFERRESKIGMFDIQGFVYFY